MDMSDETNRDYERLSDLIVEALQLAIRQKDVAIGDILSRALEMSLTRNAGIRDFVERRVSLEAIRRVLGEMTDLKNASKGISDRH